VVGQWAEIIAIGATSVDLTTRSALPQSKLSGRSGRLQRLDKHESIVNPSMHSCDEIFKLNSFKFGEKRLVHSVESVSYSFLKRFPPILVISADGLVFRGDSSDPELRAVTGAVTSDGILELAFISNLHPDANEETLQPIHADLEWRDCPERVQQITVLSNTNQITTTVGKA
jgi:hypothetical protein